MKMALQGCRPSIFRRWCADTVLPVAPAGPKVMAGIDLSRTDDPGVRRLIEILKRCRALLKRKSRDR
jgi:hypothetical protein